MFCEHLQMNAGVMCFFLSTLSIFYQKRVGLAWGSWVMGWEVRVYGSCRVLYCGFAAFTFLGQHR